MSYEALYRRWRPKKFEDVIGQEHITTTLRNQIKYNRIAHAYIFSGTRGTGKTSTARIFAKAVNCPEQLEGNPCNQCKVCSEIEASSIMDVIEIDAASNRGIDEIRDLLEKVHYPPSLGTYKVYIIDEVHMLTQGAYNALLKTLEEPPKHVIFILATTEIYKMPATILSRCQRFDFKRVTIKDMVKRMGYICREMGYEVEERALELVAKNAEGAMRDALSILDQCLSLSREDSAISYEDIVNTLGLASESWLFDLSKGLIQQDTQAAIELLHQMIDGGRDLIQIVKQLIEHFRNILMVKTLPQAEEILEITQEQIHRFIEIGQEITEEKLFIIINALNDTEGRMKMSSQPTVILEMELIKLCKPPRESNLESIIERINLLERKLEEGSFKKASEDREKDTKEKDTKEKDTKEKDTTQKKNKEKDTKEKMEGPSVNKATSDKGPKHSSITLDSIQKRWNDILREVKKQGGVQIEALLKEGKPAQLKDSYLSIAFDLGFHQAKLSEKNNTQLIEDVISQLMGGQIRVACLMSNQILPPKGQGENEVVKAAIEIFGKDVVEIVEDED